MDRSLRFGPVEYSPDQDYEDYMRVAVHVDGQAKPVCILDKVDGRGKWMLHFAFCEPTPALAALGERDLCRSLEDSQARLRRLLKSA